jgi:CDP-4-dehydro-6-deoxyglucose reductase
MICSSVNRFFISNLLHARDWTLKLRATQTGGTSAAPLASVRARTVGRWRAGGVVAGQRVRLTFGQTLGAELPVASCPCEDRHLEFHVRRLNGNPFADHVFEALAPGEEVTVEGPFGDFVLDRSSTRPLLFLAFSTGFAPIKSLMEHALALDNAPAIHLLWVAPRASALYAANLGRAWADALDHVDFTPVIAGGDLTATASRQQEAVFRVLEAHLAPLAELPTLDAYVAGPPLLVQAARTWLGRHGVQHIACDEEAGA